MKIYYLTYRKAIKKGFTILLVGLLALALGKTIEYKLFKPAVSTYEPIFQGSAGTKKIALTCNVFWGEQYLPEMLEILQKNNIKITFFMGGSWVKRFPDLTKTIAQNNEMGNHTYSHPHPTFISKEQNIKEIKKTEDLLFQLTEKRPNLYAPPYGEFNQTVVDAAGESGYRTIMWSIDTIDWKNPPASVIVQRVCDKAHNGAIVLMHPTKPTVEALPTIISKLKSQGYEITTVTNLLDGPGEKKAKKKS